MTEEALKDEEMGRVFEVVKNTQTCRVIKHWNIFERQKEALGSLFNLRVKRIRLER